MTVFLSLITAAIFGTGDFFGGLSAKRATIVQVVAGSHMVGLVGVTVVAFLVADKFSLDALLVGGVAGIFGGIGVGFLYRRLAIGPMSVVAPITAITSAAVPAAWGAITGEALSALAWAGIALALVAIGLVSSSNDSAEASISAQVIAESLTAGVGFGLFFVLLDSTDSVNAPWPVVGARMFTAIGLVAYMVATRRAVFPAGRTAVLLIAATGLLDTASNVIFLYATNRGSLTVVSVLSSLYPVATVLLARFVLSERMSRTQIAGFAAALVATAMIAAG